MRISDWSSDVCSADLDELQVRRRDRCPCSGTGPQIDWILETHAHADHLSAAPYLQEKLGGKLVIGREIVTVQGVFGKIFNEGTEFARDGSQFDQLEIGRAHV